MACLGDVSMSDVNGIVAIVPDHIRQPVSIALLTIRDLLAVKAALAVPEKLSHLLWRSRPLVFLSLISAARTGGRISAAPVRREAWSIPPGAHARCQTLSEAFEGPPLNRRQNNGCGPGRTTCSISGRSADQPAALPLPIAKV